jgi:hypothetical protein
MELRAKESRVRAGVGGCTQEKLAVLNMACCIPGIYVTHLQVIQPVRALAAAGRVLLL